MDAIILAAGMGKRLKGLTKDKTKCMITVNEVTLIERMLNQLDNLMLDKIIIVVGYKAENLKKFIFTLNINTKIEFVLNDVYDKTNNIYSLFLAKDYLKDFYSDELEADYNAIYRTENEYREFFKELNCNEINSFDIFMDLNKRSETQYMSFVIK